MSWIVWEEQTCEHIDCLYRAIGSRVMFMVPFVFTLWETVRADFYVTFQMQLRTVWMGRTIKLLDFIGKCHISLSGKTLKKKKKPFCSSKCAEDITKTLEQTTV